MTNNALVDQLAAAHALSTADARAILSSVFRAIAEAAARGEEISVSNFGKFKVKDRAARESRNPRTGEPMSVPASKRLTFTAGKTVKAMLNDRP